MLTSLEGVDAGFSSSRRATERIDLAALVHCQCLEQCLAQLLNEWTASELSGRNSRRVKAKGSAKLGRESEKQDWKGT